MASRSLSVHPDWISKVKKAYDQAYFSSRQPNQKQFAALIPVDKDTTGLGIDTLNNFLKGRPVDRAYFYAICDRLGLKEREITVDKDVGDSSEMSIELPPENSALAQLSDVMEAECEEIEMEPDSSESVRANSQNVPKVEQKADVVEEGVMLGACEEVEINQAGKGVPSSIEEDSQTALKSQKARPSVSQEVREIKPGGIVIGSSNRAVINQDNGG